MIFGEIIAILLEAYMEFSIAGYLQLQEPLNTMNGEYAGLAVSLIGLFLILVAIPLAFLFVLTRDREMLLDLKFEERWGALYEGLKMTSRWEYAFFLIFVTRRIIFVGMAVYIPFESNYFQVIGLVFINLFVVIYQGLNKPMVVPLHNRIEYFNESLIGVCSYLMMCFTDWVPDQDMQVFVGWALIDIIFFFTAVGLLFVFYFGMKANVLLYRKYKNRFDFWWLKTKAKYKRKYEKYREQIGPEVLAEEPPLTMTDLAQRQNVPE